MRGTRPVTLLWKKTHCLMKRHRRSSDHKLILVSYIKPPLLLQGSDDKLSGRDALRSH